MSPDERFIAIETKVAYHEDLVQSLNETIVAQARRLGELESRYQSLLDRLASIAGGSEPIAPADEVPPHY